MWIIQQAAFYRFILYETNLIFLCNCLTGHDFVGEFFRLKNVDQPCSLSTVFRFDHNTQAVLQKHRWFGGMSFMAAENA